MPTAFVTHPDCLKHEMGAYHPERPERLAAIEDQLIASGVGQYLVRYDAPLASDPSVGSALLEYERSACVERGYLDSGAQIIAVARR